eukprot:TRINITY_DN23232_c0_g1_i1.p1 TRINITY_DN23232_c0_g1~~TRINITY_DN23232_c0_g1_i1.p1  ORF type:complete len:271 (-),score=26.10 TRINITY_DN23232_c0_g1_i1:303-1115(-)
MDVRQDDSPTSILCMIAMLNGDSFALSALSSWRTWHLRRHVELHSGVPCYEQQFCTENVKLRSNDMLQTFVPADGSPQLNLTLSRTHTPECLSRGDVNYMWEGFLLRSQDGGDTVDGAYAAELLRFGGFFEGAEKVSSMSSVPKKFAFSEFLEFVVSCTQISPFEVPSAVMRDAERLLWHSDPLETGFVTRHTFKSAMRTLFKRYPEYPSYADRLEYMLDNENDGVQLIYPKGMRDHYEQIDWKPCLRRLFSKEGNLQHVAGNEGAEMAA